MRNSLGDSNGKHNWCLLKYAVPTSLKNAKNPSFFLSAVHISEPGNVSLSALMKSQYWSTRRMKVAFPIPTKWSGILCIYE